MPSVRKAGRFDTVSKRPACYVRIRPSAYPAGGVTTGTGVGVAPTKLLEQNSITG